MLAYKVAVLNTVQDFFYYTSTTCTPKLGDRVWVPFRNKRRLGIVISKSKEQSFDFKLLNIESVIDNEPLLSPDILKLLLWVADYYKSPLPLVLKLAIPKNYRQGKDVSLPTKDYFQVNPEFANSYPDILKRAKKQLAIVDFVANNFSQFLRIF